MATSVGGLVDHTEKVNFDTETTAKLASCDARWATECSFAIAMAAMASTKEV